MENGDVSVIVIYHFDSFYFGFQTRLEEHLLLIEVHRVVWSIQADVVFSLLVFKLYMQHNLVKHIGLALQSKIFGYFFFEGGAPISI